MLKSIKRMLDAFEQKGIVYCHWKSNEHLAEALTGDTDLDVLFAPEQRSLLDATLNECGLKRFRSTPLMQYNAIEDFIGFDEEEGKIWHLHTHYRMTLGEKHLKGYTITPWTKIILDNRRWDERGIWCSAIEDELVLLVVRMTMKLRCRDFGHKVGKEDLVELKWLQERADEAKLKAAAEKMVGEKAAPMIIDVLVKGLTKKNQMNKLHKVLLKELKLFTGYSAWGSRWMRTKRELFWLVGGVKRRLGWNSTEANRRVSPSGGLVVSFLGCDGAGKSTTLAYVKKEFNKKLDVATVYFGSGDGSSSLLRKPMKLVAQRVGGKGIGHAVEKEYKDKKKKVSLKSRIYSVCKIIWAVTLASEKKGKFRDMAKARNNGMLVLTDRYPQTNMPGCSDGPLLHRYMDEKGLFHKIAVWEENIYKMAKVNQPDLVIKLMVPTDVAIARKPEMTHEEIEQKKAIVMSMDVAEKTVVIDTSRPFEETRSEVMAEIWKLI